MAAIDTGGSNTSRRGLNHEMPLVPFIDFLLCLISFLLITAVWSRYARIDADANVPGQATCGSCGEKTKQLHVDVKGQRFLLTWREGSTVVASTSVERKPLKLADGSIRYPELTQKLADEWKSHGVHRNPSDGKRDQAVLHTENSLEYGELIAVVDAMSATERPLEVGANEARIPAFNVNFATN
jgi:biopolymer transport protein ExbD